MEWLRRDQSLTTAVSDPRGGDDKDTAVYCWLELLFVFCFSKGFGFELREGQGLFFFHFCFVSRNNNTSPLSSMLVNTDQQAGVWDSDSMYQSVYMTEMDGPELYGLTRMG